MKIRLPINTDVLKWARNSLGLSLDEVAQRLGAKFKAEIIQDWENGESSPTYPQLEKLAQDIYKRPIAVFFFPIVPQEETPEKEFRTLPDFVIDELPTEIIKLYRKAKLYQLYLEELHEGLKPFPVILLDVFSLKEISDYTSVTKGIRQKLEISIEEQSSWRSVETAFKVWRQALEANGIFVFKEGFRNDNYSGFCLYHEKYPIIFVNNSMPTSRQVFTLFHELGHLLFHSGGIDFRNTEIIRTFQGYYQNIEVSCNRFANEFLIPQEDFISKIPKISEENFNNLAEYYSVSREVILRKYLDLGLIDNHYYEEMAAKWSAQIKKKKETIGNYYYNQRTYLGERYINLVYNKFYQNKITIDSVAEYFNVKIKNLPAFENVVMEGGKR